MLATDFSKLKRNKLLELMLEFSKENEELREENNELKRQLEDKYMNLSEAGSIAEAAIRVSGVFETAQQAAERYLENIQKLCEEQERICQNKYLAVIEECKQKEEDTRIKCEKMLEDTASQRLELIKRLEKFYEAHEALREMEPTLYTEEG